MFDVFFVDRIDKFVFDVYFFLLVIIFFNVLLRLCKSDVELLWFWGNLFWWIFLYKLELFILRVLLWFFFGRVGSVELGFFWIVNFWFLLFGISLLLMEVFLLLFIFVKLLLEDDKVILFLEGGLLFKMFVGVEFDLIGVVFWCLEIFIFGLFCFCVIFMGWIIFFFEIFLLWLFFILFW